ncbi:amino acid adenylation domain-containing protein [Streptomyces sp. 604F]|uniref:amino acid adenylation domain-containing protein n=1 Tax=Streptomyces sp. 604F TaxID=1476754 RepID=UPI001EF1D420|nr:amino acid adenylation domain-containing protein [Streptomyces sp. 604F]
MNNGTTSSPPAPRRLIELVESAAARHPEAVALETPGEAPLTYRELMAAVDRLAHHIVAQHGPVPSRIGLIGTKCARTYAAYLAVLKLGATVVPVSHAAPAGRLRAIAEAADLSLVLTDNTAGPAAALAEGSRCRTVGIPDLDHAPGGDGFSRPADAPAPQRTAYILFTSGSTGRPKGVPVSHANALSFVTHNIARYRAGPGDRMSQNFDFAFDVSVFDLFVAWGSGATLVASSAQDLMHPVRWVNSTALTHWTSVPSAVTTALGLGELTPGCMPSLRMSLFLGEQLTVEQAEAWHAATPGGELENVYGPTELTVYVSAYRLPERTEEWPATANRTIPIGHVYPHLESVVVTEGREADEGELCVRGPQRFDGYLDPKDNAGRFLTSGDAGFVPLTAGVPGPADWYRTGDLVRRDPEGMLTHLGRLDSQVKIRGHRVEPAEIEGALRRHEELTDAVVLAVEGRVGSLDLVAYYTGGDVTSRDLRGHLSALLPSYMIPRRFTRLDAFPLNGNGKIDRRALARPSDQSGEASS